MGFPLYRKRLSPPWLRTTHGDGWSDAFGGAEDASVTRAKEATKARFPLIAPADALVALSNDRVLPRFPGESDAAFRARLASAFDSWAAAGTPLEMLRQFERFDLYPRIETVTGTEFHINPISGALETANVTWRCDPSADFWNKWTLLWPLGEVPWAGDLTDLVGSALAQIGGIATEAAQVVLTCTTSGTILGGTARFRLDVTPSSTGVLETVTGITAPLHGVLALDAYISTSTGIILTLAKAATAGDHQKWEVRQAFPLETDDVALAIKRIAKSFAPAHALCSGIVFGTYGEIWGWPHTTWDDIEWGALWGVNSAVRWTPL